MTSHAGLQGTPHRGKTEGVVFEIGLRGSGGGPLAALADQLNDDVNHLQGQRAEGALPDWRTRCRS